MDTPLDPVSLRILGALVEKELSTPEYYPLTASALLAACNQTTSRDPVLRLDPSVVEEGIAVLEDLGLVEAEAGARSTRFAQRLTAQRGLGVQEAAILGELLLRGPQTPGELRSRCTRMYAFADLGEVEAVLGVMTEGEAPLVVALPRQPGTKEVRFAHTLGEAHPVAPVGETGGRIARLEADVQALRAELGELRGAFEAFRGQF